MSGVSLPEVCVCADCRATLRWQPGSADCMACGRHYDVVDGIPLLLPSYDQDETRERYLRNYDRIANDDLEKAIVANRFELMHRELINFVGDVRGKAVLDIGSAYASYLTAVDARVKVAVDIALPYLRKIPQDSKILRICGDAEKLPVRLDLFDVVIISDVLEHLLEPEALVASLQELRVDARVVVHTPWRESLEQYRDVPYEFTHLRSFNETTFRTLFWWFDVVREREVLPRLDQPLLPFRVKRYLPRRLYNWLVGLYFETPLSELEYRRRERWINGLPRGRWLLRFYEPQFMLLELRKRRRPLGPHRRLDSVARGLIKRWVRRAAPVATRAPEVLGEKEDKVTV